MKKEERLQQQCDVCGRLLDKNISNFRKYSRKTNGLNFHTTCRDCEDRIKLNTEWKDGKLLCHICGEYKEPSEFTYAGATFFDRNFHFNLPTDLTNVSKLLFTGYFSTYRVTVDADSVTNNAVCQSGVTTEIPINQAYIGGDTANISINVII